MASARAVAVFNFQDSWMQEMILKEATEEFDVRFVDDPQNEADVKELLAQADFLVTVPLPGRWVAAMSRCRLVQLQGVGYDAIDTDALAAAGIPMALTPEGTIVGVAEHTILMILSLYKRITETDAHVKRGEFDKLAFRPQCHFLEGKTLGVVGFGRIGRRVAELAHAFEVDTIYSDIVQAAPEVEQELGARHVEFDELLAQADVVTLHTPLSEETEGLFQAEQFQRMKPGALFINTSRGGTYDMDALSESLRTGHLGGAGLDVFNPQPPPTDHPILKLPNVVCSPHMAAGTVESHRAKARAQFDNFRRMLAGDAPINEVKLT